jgi:hypothetical protein
MRELKAVEKLIVRTLAEKLDPMQRDQLLSDIAHAQVEPLNDSGTILRFHITGYSRPVPEGDQLFPVEAKAKDLDGADLEITLHHDRNGRLLDLEIIRWESGPFVEPRMESLVVY